MIFYRCVTGNHTGNYYLITSCLSVTFPPHIEVLKLSNKAWFLLQELSNFHRFNCRVLLRSYSFNLRFKRVNFLFENGVVESKACNSFIQKDCMIFYCCVTGNHTGNYFLITSCLSVTSPSRIVVLKLWNEAWFLRQELSNFHRFNCRVFRRSYSFHLPLQKGYFSFWNGVVESKTCKQHGRHKERI